MKKINLWLLFLCLGLSGCGSSVSTAGTSVSQTSAQAQASAAENATSTVIRGDGNTLTIDGPGATADGSCLTITAAGTYTLTGSLTEGQITVNAGKDDVVTLLLDGFAISSSQSAPIQALQGQLILQLKGNTDSTVIDTSPVSEEIDAAIYAKDDILIEGTGTLTVTSQNQGGIHSKDQLFVNSGSLDITSAMDALKGKDGVTCVSGDVTLVSDQDGIVSDLDDETGKGFVLLQGGSYTITTGGGYETTPSETVSSKGIKASGALTVEAGVFTLNTSDDALHCGGELIIRDGTFSISTGDDAVHSDTNLTVDSGTITITNSNEGLEGGTVTVNGGTIDLTSSDDGINAAGSDTATESLIHITGGTLSLTVGGDGLDSNGNLLVDGGTITIDGPADARNSPLDYDKTGTINGGQVFASGYAGMFQTFGSDSSVPSIVMYYEETQAAGTAVTLTASDGTTLFSQSPALNFSAVLLSSGELTGGQTYTLKTGDTATEITVSADSRLTEAGTKPTGAGMGGRGGMGRGAAPDGSAPAAGERPERGQMPGGKQPGASQTTETN